MTAPATHPSHVIEFALSDLKRWGQLVRYLGSHEREIPPEVLYVIGSAIERAASEALTEHEAAVEAGQSLRGRP